jgi:hypothetical protein
MAVRSTGRGLHRKLGFWQEPTFKLLWRPDLVALTASATDPDLLPALADGFVVIEQMPRGRAGRVYLRGLGLHRPMYAAMCDAWQRLQRRGSSPSIGDNRLYLHGAVSVSGVDEVGLMFGPAAPSKDQAIAAMTPTEVTLERLRALMSAQQAAETEATASRMLEEAISKPLEGNLATDALVKVRGALKIKRATGKSVDKRLPPLSPLLKELPWALAVRIQTPDSKAISRATERALRSSPHDLPPPPVDGTFLVIVAGSSRGTTTAFVTWKPHRGLPPYAEVRAAVEQTTPSAFARPRRQGAHPPPNLERSGEWQAVAVGSLDFPEQGGLSRLAELPVSDIQDYKVRARRARDNVGEAGFEAIAWYQPHHDFSRDSWGIYIAAERLDDLVCVIADDLIDGGFPRRPFAIAQALALALVFEHQLFHARVDAVLTWVELFRHQPVYLAYSRNVYRPTQECGGAIEEALADYWAWTWIFTDLNLRWLSGQFNSLERDTLQQVVNTILDLSRRGHSDWRSGNSMETWRRFGTQALRGGSRALRHAVGLPVHSLFQDPMQFMFRPRDVPLHVVGTGQAIGALLSSPVLTLHSRHR